jgi:dolichol-phosphate mannosyltransferase
MVTSETRVSVAVPVYNEAAVLPELLDRLRAVLAQVPGGPHQILFVDDGSTDDTLATLEAEAASDSRIEVLSLARNFGHQAAVTAALDFVTGDVAVVMDADLQDPPEAIPLFLEEYRKGFDVVYARRARRKERWALRLSYFLFYRLIARLADLKLPLDAGDFGLLSRRVVMQLRKAREHHRYIRGLRTWVGFRQTGIQVERSYRYAGASKYSMLKLVKLAADGVFAFSTAPLRAAALIGALAMTLSAIFAAYALYARFFLSRSPQGFTALIISITFLSGVQLLFLGVIGEYLGRVYEEVKGRPIYVVERRVGQAVVSAAGRTTDMAGTGRTIIDQFEDTTASPPMLGESS